MLHCFTPSFRQSSSDPTQNHRLPSQGNSAGNTPRSNGLSSPGVNPSLEFAKSIHTPSYNEVWTKIHDGEEYVLQPNDECIQEILNHGTNPFAEQLATYFSHTEQICRLLLILNQGIHLTRSLYIPIENLIDVLPGSPESMNQAQCDFAYDIFIQFDNTENPFPGPHNYNCMHRCFSDLKDQVNGFLHKPRPLVCTGCAGSGPTPRDRAHAAQLDGAARSAYVLHNDLQTIDRLASLLQTAVEGDRFFVRIGVARGSERYPVCEVVKCLAKSHPNVRALLADLEVHICLCFTAINRARSLLLQEIQLHQSL